MGSVGASSFNASNPVSRNNGWPGFLSPSAPPCTQTRAFPGANLCSVSCMREMARGDTEFVTLTVGSDAVGAAAGVTAGVTVGAAAVRMEFKGLGTVCTKRAANEAVVAA
jgi:hypothetical protein